jgi:AcrR family transcriptional regulator
MAVVGKAESRDANSAATRERILIEASELFARHGYLGTSTRAIAEAVQIKQPSLFHHFPTKGAIMEELLRHSLEASVELVESLVGAEGSPAKRFEDYIRFDIEFVFSSPYNYVGLYRQDVLDFPEFREVRRLYNRMRIGRERLLAEGIESGEFIEIDVELADDAVGGLVLGTIGGRTRRGSDPQKAAKELAAFAIRALRRGRRSH